jgi:hypothetical protein
MTVTVRIPTKVGADYTPATVWKGDRKLGELVSKPKVRDGRLYAGKFILALRHIDQYGANDIGPETISFTTDSNGKPLLEVHYEGDTATYELWDDPVVWSDGPPHPDHLQLAVRVRATTGVREPQVR